MLRSLWSPRLMDHLCHERKPKELIEMMNAQIGSNPFGIFTQGSQTGLFKNHFHRVIYSMNEFSVAQHILLMRKPVKYWAEMII